MLFCTAIRRYSVFLLRFPILSHARVFLCEISPVCRLKYQYICFSSHFCFLIIVVLLIIVLFVLFLVAVISPSLLFFMMSLSRRIDVSMQFSMLARHLSHFFLGTYSLSMLSQGFKDVCIVITFLVLWSICWSSSLVHFKNSPRYFQEG